jgi:hypothetical protein
MSSESGLGMQAVIDAVEERVSSPVFGTFIIFFVLWNWSDFAFFLRSELGIEDIVAILKYRFSFASQVGFPILGTIGYLAVFPWIQDAASWYRQFAQLRMAEQTADIRARALQAKGKEIRELNRLAVDSELAVVKVEIVDARAELENIRKQIQRGKEELEGSDVTEQESKGGKYRMKKSNDSSYIDTYIEDSEHYPIELAQQLDELEVSIDDLQSVHTTTNEILSSAVKRTEILSVDAHMMKTSLNRLLELAPKAAKNADVMVEEADKLQEKGLVIVASLQDSKEGDRFREFLNYLASALESLREIQDWKRDNSL